VIEMNNTYNAKRHKMINQLFEKFSPKSPGFAYIASFDSGVTISLLKKENRKALQTKGKSVKDKLQEGNIKRKIRESNRDK